MRKHEILIVVLTIIVGVEDKILTRVSKSVSIVRRVRGKISSEHTSSREHVSTKPSFNDFIRKDGDNTTPRWIEYTTPKYRTILRDNSHRIDPLEFPRKYWGKEKDQVSSKAEINYINLRKNFNSHKARQYTSTTLGMDE